MCKRCQIYDYASLFPCNSYCLISNWILKAFITSQHKCSKIFNFRNWILKYFFNFKNILSVFNFKNISRFLLERPCVEIVIQMYRIYDENILVLSPVSCLLFTFSQFYYKKTKMINYIYNIFNVNTHRRMRHMAA